MPQSTAAILERKRSARISDSREPARGQTAERSSVRFFRNVWTHRTGRRLQLNLYPRSFDRNTRRQDRAERSAFGVLVFPLAGNRQSAQHIDSAARWDWTVS